MRNFNSEDLNEFKRLFPNAKYYEEGGFTYFLLPELELPQGCQPEKVDALLCPMARDGYTSRLFFASQVQSRQPRNWNAQSVRIIERNWFAFSWQIPVTELSLVNLLGAHLRALQ